MLKRNSLLKINKTKCQNIQVIKILNDVFSKFVASGLPRILKLKTVLRFWGYLGY